MKLNDKYKIANEFESLFTFENKNEEIEHEKTILSLKFLNEIQTFIDAESLTKKDIAQKLETSASYITQLFKGDRLVNMEILAKFQDCLNFTFDIKANSNYVEYKSTIVDYPFKFKSIEIKNGNFFKKINNSEYKKETKELGLVNKLETA